MGQTGLFSIRKHMQYQGCSFFAEAQHTTVTFPTFIIKPCVAEEIDVFCIADMAHNSPVAFDPHMAKKISIYQSTSSSVLHQQLHLFPTSPQPFIPANAQHKLSQTVSIQKLVPHAQIPSHGTQGSIGYDVCALSTITINPGERAKIPTGLALSMPSSMYMRIADWSSMAVKGLAVKGGVVDSDYSGEIKVILANETKSPLTIQSGSKMAQFIFESAHTPLIQVKQNLSPTTRTKGGFGSTDSIVHQPRIKTVQFNDEEILLLKKNKLQPILKQIQQKTTDPTITNPPSLPTPTTNDIPEQHVPPIPSHP